MSSVRPIRARSAKNVLAALLLLGTPVSADVIDLRADAWCPFNCDPASDQPGYMVEVAQEALALFGHEVRYTSMTWSRSLSQALSGDITSVIGTDQEESPDLILGPPMGNYQEAVVFRAGEARSIATAEDLEGIRIGAILDYEYNTVIAAYVAENARNPERVQMIGGDDALKRNLQKLKAGRIDMAIDERSVVTYMIDQLGLQDDLQVANYGEATELHIGFSPALEASALYAQQLTEGVAQLKASGRYGEILKRYGLTE